MVPRVCLSAHTARMCQGRAVQYQPGGVPAKILRRDHIITDSEADVPDRMYLTPVRARIRGKHYSPEAEPNERSVTRQMK